MAGRETLLDARPHGRKWTQWTKEMAIQAVQTFQAKHGYQPVSNEAGTHHGLPSWGTARRLFGSWNAMIEAAGFVPYPARSSANAKTRAFRDRNPEWRETLFGGAKVSRRGA